MNLKEFFFPSPKTLTDIAKDLNKDRGSFSKPYDFYDAYEPHLKEFRDKPIKVVEVGVFQGESTKVFSRYFPKGSIIGIDLERQDIDFSGFPNVVYAQGNQTNADDLYAILDKHAPNGIDIIIDDASHVGFFSKITFDHLFSRLNPGGIYIVEDWCTGYYSTWPDGGLYKKMTIEKTDRDIPNRITSHDLGMVGFLKSLIDRVGAAELTAERPIAHNNQPPVEFLHVYPGTAILKKARTGAKPVVNADF